MIRTPLIICFLCCIQTALLGQDKVEGEVEVMTAKSEVGTKEMVLSLFNTSYKQVESNDEVGALESLMAIVNFEPENVNALWQASYYSSRVGFRHQKEIQNRYYDQALELAIKATSLGPENANAHFAMAAVLGRIAQVSSARDKMEASMQIDKYALRAIQLDPEHAGAWHIHGIWQLKMSHLSETEIEASKMLYGHAPENVSGEQAVEALRKAVKFNSFFLLYRFALARALQSVNLTEDALGELEYLLAMPNSSIDDPGIRGMALELMDRLNR